MQENGNSLEIEEYKDKLQKIEEECEHPQKGLKIGLVHIYYGDGRGKTSIALGTALRASGYGFRTKVIQFMKGIPNLGECRAELRNFEVKQFGNPKYVIKMQEPREEDLKLIRMAVEEALSSFNSGSYDIVVLDEVLYALEFGLISREDLISVIKAKPRNVELILTGGRSPPPEIIELADYVSHIVMERHPYNRGIEARRGIDF
ncbi:MAG: cob(I)yrinic acid a,c-diamide adenosyltransferase [Candidatus Woesearchaeota archaeon]